MSEFLRKFKGRHSGYFRRAKDIIKFGDWNLKKTKDFRVKEESFKSENIAVVQMIKRLSAFIKGADGDRHLKDVQLYIDGIVNIIDIHLKKIERYYDKNIPDIVWQQKHKIVEEQEFQQQLFDGEIKIQEELDKLNISNDFENLQVSFFNNNLASLPMKDVLMKTSFDIAEKINSLDVDWDIIIDNSFYINMDEREIPTYNPKKHFFDQDKDTLQFYISEWNKIKKGITIDGYYIHGWLYFHLNYFKTPIPVVNSGEQVINPPLRDNEWYLHEILKDAEQKAKDLEDAGVMVFGTRRFSKSTFEASWSYYKGLVNPNGNVTVTATNERDLISITDKIKTGIEYQHPAFYINPMSKDWAKVVEFGLKEKNGRKLKLFNMDIINTDSGSKRGGQKTAGGAPIAYVGDEVGKEDFLESYNAAIPSFETTTGWKTVPFYMGTGGNEDLSKDAEKVLSNPKVYRFIEMDWNILEHGIPKEYITWKRRKFGWFIPAQMGYKKGFKRIEKGLGEFLRIESKELDKIRILQTDWDTNTRICKEARELVKSDKGQLQQEIVFYPLDPEECFMSAKNNPFPASIAKRHKERIIAQGNQYTGAASAVELYRDEENPSIIKTKISQKDIAVYPHPGGFINSPFLLFEPFPTERPPMFRFVAGFDDYKHEQSDGDSVGGFYIFDRILRKVVLSLATRPDPHGYIHQQIHMALDAYNCVCFPENEDMKIKDYFDKIGLSFKYLGEGFDVSKKLNFTNTGNRKFGWQPGKDATPRVVGFLVDYCKQQIEIKDKDGKVIDTRLGVELIDDIHLLEEIIKYKPDGNFDRIIALASAMFYDHYYTITYKVPRMIQKKQEDEDAWKGRDTKVRSRNRYFSGKRRQILK
jgi:hypothetical protein